MTEQAEEYLQERARRIHRKLDEMERRIGQRLEELEALNKRLDVLEARPKRSESAT